MRLGTLDSVSQENFTIYSYASAAYINWLCSVSHVGIHMLF